MITQSRKFEQQSPSRISGQTDENGSTDCPSLPSSVRCSNQGNCVVNRTRAYSPFGVCYPIHSCHAFLNLEELGGVKDQLFPGVSKVRTKTPAIWSLMPMGGMLICTECKTLSPCRPPAPACSLACLVVKFAQIPTAWDPGTQQHRGEIIVWLKQLKQMAH